MKRNIILKESYKKYVLQICLNLRIIPGKNKYFHANSPLLFSSLSYCPLKDGLAENVVGFFVFCFF